MANKVKQGDQVIIRAGKDKGRIGKVLRLLNNNRLIVEGVNVVKKHLRPNPNKNVQGGIIDRESSISISNVALYNPATKKADRVGFKVLDDGRKVRCFKSNGEMIEV